MAVKSEITFESCNSKSVIYATVWKPETKIKGILQIAHGMKEHIGRYEEFGQYLADKGFLVVGDDHSGHGRTGRDEGNMGYFVAAKNHTGFYTVVKDMHRLTTLMKQEYPEVPYFLLGHSLGSFFTRAYCMNFGNELNGVIIMGTGQMPAAVVAGGSMLLDFGIRFLGEDYYSGAMNKMLSYYFDMNFMPVRTISDWVNSIPEEVDIYNNDPYCTFDFSFNGFKAMTDALIYIQEPRNVRKMPADLPVLLLSGKCDPLGENGKGVFQIYKDYKKAGVKDIKAKLYSDCRHEILRDKEKTQVMSDIEKWILAHMK